MLACETNRRAVIRYHFLAEAIFLLTLKLMTAGTPPSHKNSHQHKKRKLGATSYQTSSAVYDRVSGFVDDVINFDEYRLEGFPLNNLKLKTEWSELSFLECLLKSKCWAFREL